MRKRLVQALCGLIGAGVAVGSNTAAADKLSRFKAWSPRQLGLIANRRTEAVDWAGLYGGLQVGYGWGDIDADARWGSTTGAWEPFDYGTRGAVGGFHLGYNVDVDDIILGVEADVEASGVRGSGTGTGAIHSTNLDWSTSLRVRLGVKATDRSLIYLAAGVTYAKVSVTQHTFTGLAPFTTQDTWKAGWTVGGGIEHAISPRITARLEYRYLDLGKISYVDEVLAMKSTHDVVDHAVRAGFSVRF